MRQSVIAVIWATILCLSPLYVGAQEPRVDTSLRLADTVPAKAFAGHVSAFRDVSAALTPEDALALRQAGGFDPVPGHAPDFGFTPEPIWLYIPTQNPTSEAEWRLRLRENFFQEFSAWSVDATGRLRLLERQDETTAFSTRAIPWSELVVPFAQEPGQAGALLLRYRSGGSTEIEFMLLSVEAFNAWAADKTALHFMYYGMLVFLILAALATWTATQQGVFLAYAAYATSGLLFVMHGDGNTFRYLWPHAPAFNAFASVPLGVAIIVFGANFVRQFLQTAVYHPVFDALLLGTIGIALLTGLSCIVADTQMIKKLLVLMAFGSVLLFTASGLNAARTRFREVRFYVLAWCGAVVSASIMTGRHWLGLEISEEVQYNSMRIVFVMDAALMGLAILDRFNALRKSRADALSVSLDQARRNLELSQRLQTLEQRYALASELAQNRERRFADAVHDLRQPLHALRLNVQALLSGDAAPSTVPQQDIEKTFRFLEGLVSSELDTHMVAPAVHETRTSDLTALSEVFGAVQGMFEKDAAAKGIDLVVQPAQARVRVPAIALLRIVTNLVSNALRYTPSGRVQVNAEQTADGLRLEVHDTGPGMSEADFAKALQRGVRLDDTAAPDGSGLGLAIVARNCAEHGLTLTPLPSRLGGLSLGVTIPNALRETVRMG